MKRTVLQVEIRDASTDPASLLGTVRFSKGKVQFIDMNPLLLMELKAGVDPYGSGKPTMPSAGKAFIEAVSKAYRSAGAGASAVRELTVEE